ncbi:MAG: peptidase M54 [Myxococcaceae bacterium]
MKTLRLLAIGHVTVAALREFEAPLLAHLGLQVTYAKVVLGEPTYAFNKDRGQFHSNAILRRLVSHTQSTSAVLGVTDVDLFVPDAPFVLGESDREHGVALLSTFRLRDAASPEVYRRRLHTEAMHLAAHLIGLSPCEDARCVMFSASAASEVDRKQVTLCHVCRNEFAKLKAPV